MKLTIYTTWKSPADAIPPMFCLCRWLLDLEELPYEEKYDPKTVINVTNGLCRRRPGLYHRHGRGHRHCPGHLRPHEVDRGERTQAHMTFNPGDIVVIVKHPFDYLVGRWGEIVSGPHLPERCAELHPLLPALAPGENWYVLEVDRLRAAAQSWIRKAPDVLKQNALRTQRESEVA